MIFLIDAHMVGENETGNETYVTNLIRGLQSLNLPDRFLLATTDPAALERTVELNDHFRLARVSRSPLKRLLFDLPRVARQEELDLIHVMYAGPPFSPCPVVTTVHDVSFRHNPKWFSVRDRLILNVGISITIRRAAAVLTVSQCSKADICSEYNVPGYRIAVTYMAAGSQYRYMDNKQMIEETLGRYGIAPPYILAIGNLQPRKNFGRLIEAYARLRSEKGILHRLVIVGKEQWRESEIYDTVRRLNLTDNVIFTGHINDSDLPFLYNGADVFAYPSLYEGFGIPILEAMACGTPVVTSNVSSMPEVAGNAAILVDPVSVDSIANGLTSALTDEKLRRDLRRKGMARAQEFSWRKTAELTYDVYCRIVRETGKPAP